MTSQGRCSAAAAAAASGGRWAAATVSAEARGVKVRRGGAVQSDACWTRIGRALVARRLDVVILSYQCPTRVTRGSDGHRTWVIRVFDESARPGPAQWQRHAADGRSLGVARQEQRGDGMLYAEPNPR